LPYARASDADINKPKIKKTTINMILIFLNSRFWDGLSWLAVKTLVTSGDGGKFEVKFSELAVFSLSLFNGAGSVIKTFMPVNL
jgi:hypothetical protein